MKSKRNWGAVIVAGLLIALGVTFFSPWASSSPDGLERVAEDKGFADSGRDAPYEVIPDYSFPGIENERVSTILAGISGVLIVAGIAFVVGFVLQSVAKNRRRSEQDTVGPATGGG